MEVLGSNGLHSTESLADQPSPNSLYDTTLFTGGATTFGCEAERFACLSSLNMLDTRAEEPFDRITKTMVELFKTPVSLITLVADPSRVWFKSCVGPFGSCVERDGSWCNYILVPTTPEILITEDASKDARFAHNPYVAGEPFIKFYAGAPLVGRRGDRYGTLCIVDLVPRAYTAELYALLNNFAALAVEELETNLPLHTNVVGAALNDIERTRHYDLSLQASKEGLVMLDVRDSTWPIRYINPAFETSTGLDSGIVGSSFWELFERENRTRLDIGAIIGKGESFEISLFCKKSAKWITLRLMRAVSDRFAPSKATGIPSWVPSEDAPPNTKLGLDVDASMIVDVGSCDKALVPDSKCFWFAMVVESAASTASVANSDLESFTPMYSSEYGEYTMPAELGRILLGPLLGSGSFGKVYRGMRDDTFVVAVKVVDQRQRDSGATERQLEEIRLASSLDHPGVVRILAHATSTAILDDGKPFEVVWIVQELCDLGTLTAAAERGWLKTERLISAKPSMPVVLATLQDLAQAMAYVHSKSIIHADLTGRNVLLTNSKCPLRGFSAKVCDFGLARQSDEGKPICTDILGTITHMPPELLKENLLLPAADVWAFGVIAWEAYHGKCSYKGKLFPQIVVAVVKNMPLVWPPDAPEGFVSLMRQCLKYEYKERPSFSSLEQLLDART